MNNHEEIKKSFRKLHEMPLTIYGCILSYAAVLMGRNDNVLVTTVFYCMAAKPELKFSLRNILIIKLSMSIMRDKREEAKCYFLQERVKTK